MIKVSRSKLTKQQFIERATAVHDAKFDYSALPSELTAAEKITIRCDKHGDFEQLYHDHLYGRGCNKCSKNARRKTKDVFIQEASLIHDYRYTYHKFEYISSHEKSIITCSSHGDFLQSPANHRSGSGCPACKKVKRVTLVEFIERAIDIHRNKYDYSLVTHLDNVRMKLTIICHKHGKFEQTASMHLSGQGCPACGLNISKEEIAWLDSMKVPIEHRHKIITIDGRRFKVDGYDPISNTIYEYFGSFWHGNLDLYPPDKVNPRNKKTFRELNRLTKERIDIFEHAGYNLIYCWGMT